MLLGTKWHQSRQKNTSAWRRACRSMPRKPKKLRPIFCQLGWYSLVPNRWDMVLNGISSASNRWKWCQSWPNNFGLAPRVRRNGRRKFGQLGCCCLVPNKWDLALNRISLVLNMWNLVGTKVCRECRGMLRKLRPTSVTFGDVLQCTLVMFGDVL